MTEHQLGLFPICKCCGKETPSPLMCQHCGQSEMDLVIVTKEARKTPLPHEAGAPLIPPGYDGVVTV